jgi:hypothetical protein
MARRRKAAKRATNMTRKPKRSVADAGEPEPILVVPLLVLLGFMV